MISIQRLLENVVLVIGIFTISTYPYYHLNPYITINYPKMDNPYNKYLTINSTSDKCIVSNWSDQIFSQKNLKYQIIKL